jgi:protein-disulfide isomerase
MSILKIPIGPQDHTLGPRNAKITLVEYGDFECPYCGAAYPIVKDIIRAFGNDLLFAFRHFPITEIHPHAEHAAEAAEAAGAEGKFWEMHDMLFENQDALDDLALLDYARTLDVDLENVVRALEEGTYRPRIEKDFMSGVRSGVNGTPTFFINGHRHDGSYELEALSQALRQVIKNSKGSSIRTKQ